jgi:hypothetical protein
MIEWSPARRVTFRFGFLYLVLYFFPAPLDALPGTGALSDAWRRLSSHAARWLGLHLFRLRDVPLDGSTGDAAWCWIFLALIALVSLAGAIVWSLADERAHYERLARGLRFYLRLVVAVGMLPYGTAKLLHLQFPTWPLRLFRPIGEQSPMGLLWTFMSYSHPYNVFAGGIEVLGALLLLWRRTTALGALILVGAMSNVVMLNFAYDVPVKIGALHLLLASVVLLAPSLPALSAVLLGRPRALSPSPRWWRWAVPLASLALVGGALHLQYVDWRARRDLDVATPPSLRGVWNVTVETRDGAVVPPLVDDRTRWQRLGFFTGRLVVTGMDEKPMLFFATHVDDTAGTVTLVRDGDGDGDGTSATFHFARSGDDLVLDGRLGKEALRLSLRQVDTAKMRLYSRGFHWVNEDVYNY